MRKTCVVVMSLWLLLPCLLSAQEVDIIQLIRDGEQDQVIELLKENPDLLEVREKNLNSPLQHIAAQTNSNEVLEYLISTGIDLETINWDWHTVLHWAAYVENLEGIMLLVERGANLDAATYMGETPLRVAVDYGRTLAVRMLIDAGADYRTRAGNEVALMHAVALGGNVATAEILLEKGLDVNCRNLYGKTPLHYAAYAGNLEVAKLLVAKGADRSATDVSGRNALHFAVQRNNDEVVALLHDAGMIVTSYEFPDLTGPYLGQTPPGLEPELFAPGIVSTEGWEFAPTFTADGREMLFTRRLGEDELPRNTIITTNCYDGTWNRPEVAHFSGQYFDYEPFVIDGGQRLIFGTRRPLPEDADNEEAIQWVLDREGRGWTNPRPFGPPLKDRTVTYVTMADNGNLYYSGPNGDDGYDLFVCRSTGDGYEEPQTLGHNLDRLKPKMHPYIAPDESYVLFDAQPNSPENYDNYTYVSFHDTDGSWTTPRMIDLTHPAIRTHGIAIVSPDGKYLFFSSGGNIFWVDARVIEQYRN
jgi:ankyrin repeat protein